MAFELEISVILGRSKDGIIINARLIDHNNHNLTDVISSGFTDIGSGNYIFRYTKFPDNFRGGVKFFEQGHEDDTLTVLTINPEEIDTQKDKQLEVVVGHSQDRYSVKTLPNERTNRNIEIQVG